MLKGYTLFFKNQYNLAQAQFSYFLAISASKCSYFVLKILCSLLAPNAVIPYCTVLHCRYPDLSAGCLNHRMR